MCYSLQTNCSETSIFCGRNPLHFTIQTIWDEATYVHISLACSQVCFFPPFPGHGTMFIILHTVTSRNNIKIQSALKD